MIYVTAGDLYTDIDVYACAIVYAHLLKKQGKEAIAYLPGVLNSSVTDSVKNWTSDFVTNTNLSPNDKFVIVDISNPDHIAKTVDHDKVIELFDHHMHGFDDYWVNKIGDKAKIEPVGSCTTLIWEEYKKNNILIDPNDAKLLAIGIISNTLNLKSSVTTDRDIIALKDLEEFANFEVDWKNIYFIEQEKFINDNPKQAIIDDTYGIKYDIVFGQLELWDGSNFIKNYKNEIEDALESYNKPKWLLSIPSISEGVNYIYTKNEEIKNLLIPTISISFEGDIGKTDKLWLRKEIISKILKLK